MEKGFLPRIGCSGFKLKESMFRMNIRRKYFTVRVVKPWSRLSGAAVDAPSLGMSKAKLDRAWCSLV